MAGIRPTVRTIWNGRKPDILNFSELLTTVAIYHVYKKDETEEYLQNVNRKRLPWVLTVDIRGSVTRDVVEGFDSLFQKSLVLLQNAWSTDKDIRNEIKERIEEGEFNPAIDFIDDPKMKNAVGEVLMRQIDVRDGLVGKKAFKIAVGKIKGALKEIERFIEEVIMSSSMFFIHEMQQHSMRPVDVNALEVKIVAMDEKGPIVEFNIDEETIYLNDQREEKERGEGKKDFNPMFG